MQTANGIASIASPYSVEVTIDRLKKLIAEKGFQLFAHIDHGDGAQKAALHMQAAHVLIFGHAKAGTPLMVASPLLALDLPLKILIWEDTDKKIWTSYNTPEFLIQRHGLPAELAKNISGVEGLIKTALG